MKAYTRGNYFYIEKDNEIYEGLAKDVLVKRLTPTSDVFYFENVNNWKNEGVDIEDLQDENGDAYTLSSFIEFYEANTGKVNGGGSVSSGLTSDWQSEDYESGYVLWGKGDEWAIYNSHADTWAYMADNTGVDKSSAWNDKETLNYN